MKRLVKSFKRTLAVVMAVAMIFMYAPVDTKAAGGTVILDVSEGEGVWTSSSGLNIEISDAGYRVGSTGNWTTFDELIITGTSTTLSNSILINGIPSGSTITLRDLNITEEDENPILIINGSIPINLEGDVVLNNTATGTGVNDDYVIYSDYPGGIPTFSGQTANLTVKSETNVAIHGNFNIDPINKLTIESNGSTPVINCTNSAYKNKINASGDVSIKASYMGINAISDIDIKANNFTLNVTGSWNPGAPAVTGNVSIDTKGDVVIHNPNHSILSGGILDITAGGNVTLNGGADTSSNPIKALHGELNIDAGGDVTIDAEGVLMGVDGSDGIDITNAKNVTITSNVDDYLMRCNVNIKATGDVSLINEYTSSTSTSSKAGVVLGNLEIDTTGKVEVAQTGNDSNVSAIDGNATIKAADTTITSGYKAISGTLSYQRADGKTYEVLAGADSAGLTSLALKNATASYSLANNADKTIQVVEHICEKDDTAYEKDASSHWYACKNSDCDLKADEEAHLDADFDGKCDVCGAAVTVSDNTTTEDTTENDITTGNDTTTEASDADNAPDTGDDFSLLVCFALMILSGGIIILLHKKEYASWEE